MASCVRQDHAMGAAQELQRILRQQAGVISSRQLAAMGYSRGQIMRLTCRWQRCAPGVYLTTPLTWISALWAGLLVGGDDAVAGMEAAAFVRGIVDDEPKEIVIWVAHARREFQLGPYQIRFRRGIRAPRGTPAITTVEDTVLDTADIRPEIPAVALLTRALADGFTTPAAPPQSLASTRPAAPPCAHRRTRRWPLSPRQGP